MKVKMLTLWSSPEGTRKPGDVVDLPAKIAHELINGRAAVELKNDPVAAADAKAADEDKPGTRRGSRGRGRGKGADPGEPDSDGEPGGDGDAGTGGED